MFLRKTLTCLALLQLFVTCAIAQTGLYPFQKDDTLVREKYYKEALADKDNLIKSLGKEHRNDFKEWYESRFEIAGDLFKSATAVTEPAAHTYLQELLKKIVAANPELKDLKIRLVFTRDGWANAYSVGDGTLAVNAGLFVHLKNEAQLVFILCHEVSHLYLDHSGKRIKKSVEFMNSDELKKRTQSTVKTEISCG